MGTISLKTNKSVKKKQRREETCTPVKSTAKANEQIGAMGSGAFAVGFQGGQSDPSGQNFLFFPECFGHFRGKFNY